MFNMKPLLCKNSLLFDDELIKATILPNIHHLLNLNVLMLFLETDIFFFWHFIDQQVVNEIVSAVLVIYFFVSINVV